jgi:nucleotide-binding universal stress UspA family protein
MQARRYEMEPLIVVGVDGSDHSKAALRWALEEARIRGASLRVVHAWFAYPPLVPGTPVTASDWDALRDEARAFVERFVEETIGDPPDVEISAMAPHATAAPALVDAAEDADLLVVGSRGLGGFMGLLLGSVSRQCAQRAPCPLVIVHGTPVETEEPERVTAGTAADT